MSRLFFTFSPAKVLKSSNPTENKKPVAANQNAGSVPAKTKNKPVVTSKIYATKPITNSKFVPTKPRKPISGLNIGPKQREKATQTDQVFTVEMETQTDCGGKMLDQAVQVIPEKVIYYSPTKGAKPVIQQEEKLPESPVLIGKVVRHKNISNGQTISTENDQTQTSTGYDDSVLVQKKLSPYRSNFPMQLNFDESMASHRIKTTPNSDGSFCRGASIQNHLRVNLLKGSDKKEISLPSSPVLLTQRSRSRK